MTSGGRIPDQYKKDDNRQTFEQPSSGKLAEWRRLLNTRPTVALYEIARWFSLVGIATALNRLRMICAANGKGDEPTKTGDPSDREAYEDIRYRLVVELRKLDGTQNVLAMLDPVHFQPTETEEPQTKRINPYLRTKTLRVGEVDPARLSECPNIHKSGSVKGMKDQYWGKEAKCVRCGDYIYNVDSDPEIYDMAR